MESQKEHYTSKAGRGDADCSFANRWVAAKKGGAAKAKSFVKDDRCHLSCPRGSLRHPRKSGYRLRKRWAACAQDVGTSSQDSDRGWRGTGYIFSANKAHTRRIATRTSAEFPAGDFDDDGGFVGGVDFGVDSACEPISAISKRRHSRCDFAAAAAKFGCPTCTL